MASGDFDPAFVRELKTLSWSLYSVGMLSVFLRLYARKRRLGIKRLQSDDYLMVLAAGLYTALIVCLNVISRGGGSNLYPPEMAGTFTPEEIRQRIYGSKIVVVSEQCMLTVIYTIKTCMLIMYTRLTEGLPTHRYVFSLAAYVAVGFVSSEIAFFTACRPFSGYWAMPPPDAQCSTLERYAIVQGCFNITSDLLMLCIPLPLVLGMTILPWRQKLVLAFIFSLGIFVIIAAVLTKVFNLTDVWQPTYMLWYVREASVAICVSNLPMIWPLLRDWFPFLQSLTPKGPPSDVIIYGRGPGGAGALGPPAGGRMSNTDGSNHFERSLRLGRSRSTHSIDSVLRFDFHLESKKDDSTPDILLHSRQPYKSASPVKTFSSTEEIIPKGTSSDEVSAESAGGKYDSSSSVGLSAKGQRQSATPSTSNAITIERTVVVEQGAQNDGTRAGIFDWNHTGGSKNHTNITSDEPS